MKSLLQFLSVSLLICFGSSANAQYLVDGALESTTPVGSIGSLPGITPQFSVAYHSIIYNTIDVNGDPTVASGGLAIPVPTASDTCTDFPMLTYCHGTVLRQFDVPSAENFEAGILKLFASSGFIGVAPDYLGLGDNPGVHPYVHAESQATATIDMMRAVNEYLALLGVSQSEETFITGYSQGGHAAMATLKYAQDNGLIDELGIVAGAPCSGPYDISGFQAATILADEPYSNPGYVVYVLTSYEEAYGNIFNNLSDIIQEPYATQVAPFFYGDQNESDMGEVNAILPNLVADFMVDTVLQNFADHPLTHPLRVALADNDNYNWTPEMPLRMFYCDGDEQVNFQNSIRADSAMNANGAEDVQAVLSLSGASHGGCIFPALLDAYNFFKGLSTSCSLTLSAIDIKVEKLELYPNPVQDYLTLSLPDLEGRLVIQNISGQVVVDRNIIGGSNRINTTELSQGVYIISVKTERSMMRNKFVKQ